MCIDFKISREMKDEKRRAKYELGNFCKQYGIETIPPSRRHKTKTYKTNYSRRNYFKKNKIFRKSNFDTYYKSNKPKDKSKKVREKTKDKSKIKL